jgi:hypothetical protein
MMFGLLAYEKAVRHPKPVRTSEAAVVMKWRRLRDCSQKISGKHLRLAVFADVARGIAESDDCNGDQRLARRADLKGERAFFGSNLHG